MSTGKTLTKTGCQQGKRKGEILCTQKKDQQIGGQEREMGGNYLTVKSVDKDIKIGHISPLRMAEGIKKVLETEQELRWYLLETH